jgi:hypothetical protein
LVQLFNFLFYAQPGNSVKLAVRNVTRKAVPSVMTTLSVVHFGDFVSSLNCQDARGAGVM